MFARPRLTTGTVCGALLFAMVGCSESSPPVGGSGGRAGGTGGVSGTGGATGSGGAAAGSGGAPGTGGSVGSGGAVGSGGRGSGGAASGGSSGSGGASVSGTGGGNSDAGSPADVRVDGPAAGGDVAPGVSPLMSFFLTSRTGGGNLGGLEGADTICRTLATAVGLGNKTWRAYLSTGNPVVNAKDRIGDGPWFNAKGVMVATSNANLHDGATPANNLTGTTVVDETGAAIPGRTGRPAGTENEHDIITGTQMDGTVAMGFTCGDWRAEASMARVGHFDRGGGGGTVPMSNATAWNSSHNNQGCGPETIKPGGGAGRFYCFATN